MNLYKISQEVNYGEDTYDSAVVATESVHDAQWIHPSEYEKNWDGTVDRYNDWCTVEDVKVEYIDTAADHIKAGVIVTSFNAG